MGMTWHCVCKTEEVTMPKSEEEEKFEQADREERIAVALERIAEVLHELKERMLHPSSPE